MLQMSNFSFDYRSGLVGFLGTSLIIALIAGLIVRLVRGTDFKRKDIKNSGLINAFLYVGSFMIVGSMLMFMQDYPTAMPIVSIVGSTLLLFIGLILYGFVDFLRPVGLAFAYTGLAIIPFWFYAFHEFGMPSDYSLFFSGLATTISYIVVAALTRSQLAGWISYLCLFSIGALLPISGDAYVYCACLLPMLVALLAMVCWTRRVKWLPVGFRQATSVLAYAAVPAIAFFVVPYFAIDSSISKTPLLRSLFFFFASIHYLVAWLIEKKRALLVISRILFQVLLIALISDITGYSLLSFNHENSLGAGIAIAAIWLTGSLIQTIISLFAKTETESEASTEHAMLAVSLVCIGLTPFFCQGLDGRAIAVIFLAMSLVVAILGILISVKKKNLAWGFATLFALLLVPFEVNGIAGSVWNFWIYYAAFAAISTLALIVYTAVLRKVQVICAYRIALTAIIACAALGAFSASLTGFNGDWPCVPVIIAAAQLALLGLASGRDDCYELSIYSTAAAVYLFTYSLGDLSYDIRQVLDSPHYLGDAIFGLMLGGSVLGVGLARDRDKKNSARQIVGFICMSVIMVDAAASAADCKTQLAPLILAGAELITMFIGLATDRKWMGIASACIVAFDVMFLMNSQNWLTFGLVGAGMIGTVVWMLAKSNRTPKTPLPPQQ